MNKFNDYEAFLSIGFKPKAKDQKTFIEDLRELEYIKDLERECKLSLILEGEKVRIFRKKKRGEKERHTTWSENSYEVEKITKSLNITYFKLKGLDRLYLRNELLKV